jgi:ferredoxin--NADP+ reductase
MVPVAGKVINTYSCLNGKSASFVRHIDIDLSGTPLAGQVRAGQSIAVIPPGLAKRGNTEKARWYSVSSATAGPDGEGAVVSLCVKRLIGEYQPTRPADPEKGPLFLGKCSNHLCDLHVGDEVMVAGPSGKHFILPKSPEAYQFVFLATGTGIAPFRGFLHDLESMGALGGGACVQLIMGSPYNTDLLYHDEFLDMSSRYEGFRYDWALSREDAGTLGRRAYLSDIVSETTTVQQMLASDNTLIYICGLTGIQSGIFEALVELGLQKPYISTTQRGGRVHMRPSRRCLVEVY